MSVSTWATALRHKSFAERDRIVSPSLVIPANGEVGIIAGDSFLCRFSGGK
jgi:hypothetical protein